MGRIEKGHQEETAVFVPALGIKLTGCLNEVAKKTYSQLGATLATQLVCEIFCSNSNVDENIPMKFLKMPLSSRWLFSTLVRY